MHPLKTRVRRIRKVLKYYEHWNTIGAGIKLVFTLDGRIHDRTTRQHSTLFDLLALWLYCGMHTWSYTCYHQGGHPARDIPITPHFR